MINKLNNTYLIVFHGQWQGNKIIDIGDDPCFDGLPSWGICRPPTRKSVKQGDTLFFMAKVDNDYFLKGWFQVGDKLDYISAMKIFPSRKNVIISTNSTEREIRWKYDVLKKKYINVHGERISKFLLDIKTPEGTFYQNPFDEHEIDNWKCRRIFHCRAKELLNCVSANRCLKEGCSMIDDKYKNYIIADDNNWEVTDKMKITFNDICMVTGFNKPIKTPCNQHNVLRFDDYKQKLLDYISKRKHDA